MKIEGLDVAARRDRRAERGRGGQGRASRDRPLRIGSGSKGSRAATSSPGSYAIDGDRVTFGALAGSMMACPPPETALERAVQGTLVGTLRFAVDGDRLTLSPASGAALVFRAEPAPALEGVTWHVTGFNNGRQAVVSPAVGTELSLRFRDGAVQGQAGCNDFRAPYTSDGDRMSVGPVVATRKACPGEGVMQQEREFLAALATATTWTVRGGMLDVHRADGQRVLTANASAE